MPDIVDRAQLDEAMARRAAIWRASGGDRVGQGPAIPGCELCRDCKEQQEARR